MSSWFVLENPLSKSIKIRPRMKPLFLFLLVFPLLFFSCRSDKHTVRIEGKIDGVNQAVVMAYVEDDRTEGGGSLDSIVLERGKFFYERRLDAPTLLTLVYPNFSTTTLVAEPGAAIRLSGDANRLKEMEIDGTPSNELLTEFRLRLAQKSPNDAEMEAATFVRSHPTSPAAVVVFHDYFDGKKAPKQQPALALLELLRRSQPQNLYLEKLDKRLRPYLKTAVGATLPDFTAQTLSGQLIDNATLKGKPAVIVFSALWDGNNYLLRQSLRKLRTVFGSKVETVLVSLDAKADDMRQAARRDTLDNVICQGNGFEAPLVRLLGVRFVPGNVFIDAKGKIVARDVPFDQWEDELKKWTK